MLILHLQKEWREHRLMLFAFTIALVVCSMLTLWIAPKNEMPRDLGAWFAVAGVTLAFVGLISDLVPGEARRGQLDLLRRTPGAMRTSFVAKWALLLFGLIACAGVGFALGEITWSLGAGTPALSDGLVVLTWAALAMLGCTPLAFACSCWFGRGSGAIPATALVFGLVAGVPAVTISIYRLPIEAETVLGAIGWCSIIGLLAAWRSFNGLRFGSRWMSAKRGLATSLFAIVPIWGITGMKAWDLFVFDPTSSDARIFGACLGADGEKLYITVSRAWHRDLEPPMTTLVLDLESGSWEQTGGLASAYLPAATLTGSSYFGDNLTPMDYVLRHDGVRGDRREAQSWHLIDGRDGTEIQRFEGSSATPQAVREFLGFDQLRDIARRRNGMPLLDGSRLSVMQDHLVFVAADGGTQTERWPEGDQPFLRCGAGFRWLEGSRIPDRAVYDPNRRRNVHLDDSIADVVFVRGRDWVVRQYDAGGSDAQTAQLRSRLATRLARWNPDRNEFAPLLLGNRLSLAMITADQRVIALTEDDRTIVLYDPDTDSATAIPFEQEIRISRISPANYAWVHSPGGHLIASFLEPNGASGFLRFDGESVQATASDRRDVRLQAVISNDEILVLVEQRRLERWRFGSEQREVVFETGG
ncbi:MAG: hypothetical protein AAF196_10180 [Planctomycetota bacterium]